MIYDTYRVFELNVSEEEFNIIRKFCDFLDDSMDYIENYQTCYNVIYNISRLKFTDLKDLGFEINIEREEN